MKIGGTQEFKQRNSSEPIYIVLRHIKQSRSGVNFGQLLSQNAQLRVEGSLKAEAMLPIRCRVTVWGSAATAFLRFTCREIDAALCQLPVLFPSTLNHERQVPRSRPDFLILVAWSGESLVFDEEGFPLGLIVGLVALVLEVGHLLPKRNQFG